MKDLAQDIKVKNFATYKKYLYKLIGEGSTEGLISYLGEGTLMNASFGMSLDSGSAYEGSLILNALKIGDYASGLMRCCPRMSRLKILRYIR